MQAITAANANALAIQELDAKVGSLSTIILTPHEQNASYVVTGHAEYLLSIGTFIIGSFGLGVNKSYANLPVKIEFTKNGSTLYAYPMAYAQGNIFNLQEGVINYIPVSTCTQLNRAASDGTRSTTVSVINAWVLGGVTYFGLINTDATDATVIYSLTSSISYNV